MAIGSVGLKTHIWNNRIGSIGMLLLFPLIILAFVWAFNLAMLDHDRSQSFADESYRAWQQLGTSWPYVMLAVSLWYVVATFFHEKMIRRASKAEGVTRREEPELYNLLENICISRGIPMPKLAIISSEAMNAFASGIDRSTYTITLTRGLINQLEKDEIEAVLAHELSHIRNEDVRLLMVLVIFVGIIGFASEVLFRGMRYGRGGRKDGRLVLVMIAVVAVGYVVAYLLRFAVSRSREYMADAGAVELTKNPDALVRALQKISGQPVVKHLPEEVMQMCIENPPGVFSWFSTHPPIEKRIAVLQELAGAKA